MARVAAQVTSTGICTCRVGVRRRSPEDVVVISSMHDVITEEGGGSRAQEVIAIPTQQKVVVHTTPENVVTSITFKDVVPCSADQKIGIVAAVEPVETTPAIDRVGARTTASDIIIRPCVDRVGTTTSIDVIVPTSGRKVVRATSSTVWSHVAYEVVRIVVSN